MAANPTHGVHAKHVNLGFCHGASLAITDLPDPNELLQGTEKCLRHIKIVSVEEAQSPAVKSLLVAVIADRQSA